MPVVVVNALDPNGVPVVPTPLSVSLDQLGGTVATGSQILPAKLTGTQPHLVVEGANSDGSVKVGGTTAFGMNSDGSVKVGGAYGCYSQNSSNLITYTTPLGSAGLPTHQAAVYDPTVPGPNSVPNVGQTIVRGKNSDASLSVAGSRSSALAQATDDALVVGGTYGAFLQGGMAVDESAAGKALSILSLHPPNSGSTWGPTLRASSSNSRQLVYSQTSLPDAPLRVEPKAVPEAKSDSPVVVDGPVDSLYRACHAAREACEHSVQGLLTK